MLLRFCCLLVSFPVIETEESGGFDAGEYRKKRDGSKYIKLVEDLLHASTRVRYLMKQFEAATKIENLENELNEAEPVSRKALEEDGDSRQI
ncbi:hypothetical protein SAY87_019401 [Trapa incisa]|uniref:Uncharacterized protein n=1 Tax=Trapa incisa TaxID=236973 RepID=A0AAN7JZU0_9MYRT|nr:hypothetical protein SAY87_019401 [Trapa incisa]